MPRVIMLATRLGSAHHMCDFSWISGQMQKFLLHRILALLSHPVYIGPTEAIFLLIICLMWSAQICPFNFMPGRAWLNLLLINPIILLCFFVLFMMDICNSREKNTSKPDWRAGMTFTDWRWVLGIERWVNWLYWSISLGVLMLTNQHIIILKKYIIT